MKKIIKQFLLILLFATSSFSQINNCKLEKAASFFPQYDELNQSDIEYYYLSIPENWEKPVGKKIKVAIAILRNTSKNKTSSPVVYLEGGPGGSGIEGIWSWIEHPIREQSDIVLVDVRGTGNSLPKFCPNLGQQFLEILAKIKKGASYN
jgi:pimeloyl-ACP methyl ester carboxylesterase